MRRKNKSNEAENERGGVSKKVVAIVAVLVIVVGLIVALLLGHKRITSYMKQHRLLWYTNYNAVEVKGNKVTYRDQNDDLQTIDKLDIDKELDDIEKANKIAREQSTITYVAEDDGNGNNENNGTAIPTSNPASVNNGNNGDGDKNNNDDIEGNIDDAVHVDMNLIQLQGYVRDDDGEVLIYPVYYKGDIIKEFYGYRVDEGYRLILKSGALVVMQIKDCDPEYTMKESLEELNTNCTLERIEELSDSNVAVYDVDGVRQYCRLVGDNNLVIVKSEVMTAGDEIKELLKCLGEGVVESATSLDSLAKSLGVAGMTIPNSAEVMHIGGLSTKGRVVNTVAFNNAILIDGLSSSMIRGEADEEFESGPYKIRVQYGPYENEENSYYACSTDITLGDETFYMQISITVDAGITCNKSDKDKKIVMEKVKRFIQSYWY